MYYVIFNLDEKRLYVSKDKDIHKSFEINLFPKENLKSQKLSSFNVQKITFYTKKFGMNIYPQN